MKSFLKPSIATLLVLSLTLAISAHAEKREKGEGKAKAEASAPAKAKGLPYGGTLSAKTADSITVKKKDAEKTFAVTAATKISKDGKPATLADGMVGEPAGVYFKNDGSEKPEAISIKFGKAPAKPAGEKKEKAEKKAD